MIVARRFLVGGRVQGVGFRVFAQAAAVREGVHGFARNLDDGSMLLPPLRRIREVARGIALAVALQAVRQGVATRGTEEELDELIDRKMWTPRYLGVRSRV